MFNREPLTSQQPHLKTLVLAFLALALVTSWLLLTPSGLDGKTHAAGFAVCHQLESHSYSIGGKVLPLCARCTGTFLGLFVSLVTLFPRDRRSDFPSRGKIILLGIFFLSFLADGVHSTLTFFSGFTPLYPPSNLLRLVTGFLMGIALANLVLPLWQQTLWVNPTPAPILASWKQFILLLLLCAATAALVLADLPILYVPVAVLSTTTIFIILTMLYSLIACILLKKENTMHLYKDGFRIFIIGFIAAILQIGLMDLLRYHLSGTW